MSDGEARVGLCGEVRRCWQQTRRDRAVVDRGATLVACLHDTAPPTARTFQPSKQRSVCPAATARTIRPLSVSTRAAAITSYASATRPKLPDRGVRIRPHVPLWSCTHLSRHTVHHPPLVSGLVEHNVALSSDSAGHSPSVRELVESCQPCTAPTRALLSHSVPVHAAMVQPLVRLSERSRSSRPCHQPCPPLQLPSRLCS